MSRGNLPSPLDNPRFKDDSALSVFSISGKSVVGSKENLGSSKQYARQAYDGSPHIDPKHPLDPIGIEIVRGASGSSKDGWVVVVDGMRCKLVPSEDDPSAFSCKLPRGVELKPITSETRVRSVAVAVRLEEDAMAPLSAQVSLTQVLSSDERDDRQESNEKSMGNPSNIRPYRVADSTATSVTLPYPFWAPAQSALGILSMREANRKQEKRDAIQAYNLFVGTYNTASKLAYDTRIAAYDQIRQAEFVERTVRDQVKSLGKLTNAVNLQDISKYSSDYLKGVRSTVLTKKPKAPKAKRARTYTTDDVKESSFVIGGREESAAKELCGIFALLVRVCESVRQDDVKAYARREAQYKQLSLREQIGRMRLALLLDYDDKEAAAMFDCLMCTLPYPPTQFLLNLKKVSSERGVTYDERRDITTRLFSRQYFIQACDQEGGKLLEDDLDSVTRFQTTPFEDLSVEDRQELNKANKEFLDRENNLSSQSENDKRYEEETPDYMFVYERLTLEQRRRTTVRSRINVHIVDFDGTEFKVNFEAEEEDGIVAHAVYSNFKRDIDEFDYLAQQLVRCLFEVYTQRRDVINFAKDAAASAVDFFSSWTFRKYKNRKTRNKDTFESLYEISKYLTVDAAASRLGQLSADAPFKLDPCQVEERIAELRLMVRELLPVWPPTPPVNVDDLREITIGKQEDGTEEEVAEDTEPVTNPPDSPSEDQPELPAVDVGASYDLSEEADEYLERREQRRQLREAIRLQNEEADRQREIIEDEKNLIVYYNGTEQSSDVICRYLPHIVLPSPPPTILFSMYEFADAILNLGPTEVQSWRWGWLPPVVEGVGLTAVAATVGVFGYLGYMLAFVNITKTIVNAAADQKVYDLLKQTAERVATGLNFNDLFTGEFAQYVGNIASVAWSALGFTEASFLSRVQAMMSAATFGYNASSFILSFGNRRVRLGQARLELYQKHLIKLVDKPANSCILAARYALKTLQSDISERAGSLSLIEKTSVVNNEVTGLRFSFLEYYKASTAPPNLLESLPAVYTNVDWNSVPYGGSMRLTPPIDVTEKMYEVEHLRGPLVGGRLEWLLGRTPTTSDSTPSSLAARLAHSEMMQFVYRRRRLLRGEHLTQSAEDAGLQIVECATALLSVAYGPSAGVTLIRGNDHAWSCLRGGVAARLALRHVSLFEASEMAQSGYDGADGVKQALQFWQKPRRSIMDSFISAWKSEAQSFARLAGSGKAPKIPQISEISTEASRCFARVQALETSKAYQRAASLGVVVSSLAHDLFLASNHEGDELSSGIEQQIRDSQQAASHFEDQSRLVMPTPHAFNSDTLLAAWASRRVAPEVGRQHVVGSGAVSIIEPLSLMSVKDSTQTGESSSLYYCPVGSRLEALPGHSSFGENAMNNRIVWLSIAELVCPELSLILRDASDFTPSLSNSTVVDARSSTGKNEVGMERHPLVVSYSGKTVSVSLAASVAHVKPAGASVNLPQDILESIAVLKSSKIDFDEVRTAASRMRSIAYNADRLFFALSLAHAASSAKQNAVKKTMIRLSHPQNVLSLLAALVLYNTEYGSINTQLEVFVNRHAEMQDYLSATNAQISRALKRGCRACSLGEFSLCV